MATKEEILTQIQPGKIITAKLLTDITNLAADAQTSADTAKEDIKATLPTLQTQVSELESDLVHLEDSLSHFRLCDKFAPQYSDSNSVEATSVPSSSFKNTRVVLEANRKYKINYTTEEISNNAIWYFGLIKYYGGSWLDAGIKYTSVPKTILFEYTPTEKCYVALRPNATSSAKFKIYVYDITDLTDEQLDSISQESFDKSEIENLVTPFALNSKVAINSQNATNAVNSNYSETSNFANISNIAKYAYNGLDEIGTFENDDIGGFGSTVVLGENNEITVNSTTTYGETYFKTNFEKNKRYLIVWKGYSFSSVGCILKTHNGWDKTSSKQVVVNDVIYSYSDFTPTKDDDFTRCYLGTLGSVGMQVTYTPISVTQISSDLILTDEYLKSLIKSKKYDIAESLSTLEDEIKNVTSRGAWYGKNALVIGDSLTASKKWQKQLTNILGMNVTTHAKGGMGLIQCVDGEDGAPPFDPDSFNAGTLYPLMESDVANKDLIVFFAGYNNRGTADGNVGDCYKTDGTGQNTIAGMMQYCINRIYEELINANNLTCKIMIVTVDCAGKYPYIDADGYTEYPSGSGRTMETLANIQKAVAEHNSLACVDLWHNSGINKNTWVVFGAEPNAYYEDTTGRGGTYPHNGDQLHKSDAGYKRIGECICGGIIKSYGN